MDVHTRKTSLPLALATGTHNVIAPVVGAWIYVHEIIGDLAANGTVEILAGTTSLAKWTLDQGQGLTVTDEPGDDGRPRFEVKPGDNFIMIITGGPFDGALHYSLRY